MTVLREPCWVHPVYLYRKEVGKLVWEAVYGPSTQAQDSYVGAYRFYSYYLVINRLSVSIM